ncbi:hypothetical protein [Vulcanisaeta sp. JCM 16161]|uniref:hypothetical protein n=1 Tax=Vulcanisaeta sp. JCM 16161 TaxID=1295372 RepID=UPI001FB2E365|nr:hypothetical protein [Vulcanisaeta sp. JCM 16161]
MERNNCSQEVIRAMEEFLWALLNGGSKENVMNRLMACGEYAKPYLNVINGNDPGNTISAAVSYYQYVKLAKGELRINGNYIRGIDEDLTRPDTTYSLIIDNMVNALKAQDYVTAGFLADLAFITRSYILCVSNNGEDSCDWIRRAFNVRILILKRFSRY